jgi:maleate cis-trans isomerase
MRNLKLRTLAVATPFQPSINERLVKYLASEQITVGHDKPLGIECNTEFAGYRFPWNTN